MPAGVFGSDRMYVAVGKKLAQQAFLCFVDGNMFYLDGAFERCRQYQVTQQSKRPLCLLVRRGSIVVWS